MSNDLPLDFGALSLNEASADTTSCPRSPFMDIPLHVLVKIFRRFTLREKIRIIRLSKQCKSAALASLRFHEQIFISDHGLDFRKFGYIDVLGITPGGDDIVVNDSNEDFVHDILKNMTELKVAVFGLESSIAQDFLKSISGLQSRLEVLVIREIHEPLVFPCLKHLKTRFTSKEAFDSVMNNSKALISLHLIVDNEDQSWIPYVLPNLPVSLKILLLEVHGRVVGISELVFSPAAVNSLVVLEVSFTPFSRPIKMKQSYFDRISNTKAVRKEYFPLQEITFHESSDLQDYQPFMAFMKKCNNLRKVELHFFLGPKAEKVVAFDSLTSLEEVIISEAGNMNNVVKRIYLKSGKTIKKIELYKSSLSKECLEAIARLPKLECLRIEALRDEETFKEFLKHRLMSHENAVLNIPQKLIKCFNFKITPQIWQMMSASKIGAKEANQSAII